MLSSRLLIRIIQQKNSKFVATQTLNRTLSSSSSSDSSSSDDEKKSKKKPKLAAKPSSEATSSKKAKSEEAIKKLNLLLKRMIEDDKQETPKDSGVQLAKPIGRTRVGKKVEEDSNDIVLAAKNVAKSLGGKDIKQTELELLNKLLNPTQTQTTSQDESKSLNLSDVLAGMKIDRSVQPESTGLTSKAYRVRQAMQGTNNEKSFQQRRQEFQKKKPFVSKPIEKIDLFGSEPLGIFTKDEIKYQENQTELKTWDILHHRELELAVTHPPENYFQEMILWTKQGKVWTFPIDNEIGMDEEKNVYFADHIFLEKHLEPWCPQRGPIRHFMELVCVGLSKNPYLTVQAKKDHIDWFKDYFMSKETYLKEIGAIPTEAKTEKIKELDG